IKAEVPAKSGATVLLEYARSSDPAIILSKFGEGKVALITSSADGDWNSFYGKVDYLPLFNQLAYQLSPAADTTRNLLTGAALAEPLTADQARTKAELSLELRGVTVKDMTDKLAPRVVPVEDRQGVQTQGTEDLTGGTSADRRQFIARAEDLNLPGLVSLKVADVSPGLGPDGRPLPPDRVEQQSKFIYAVNPPALAEGNLRTFDVPAIKTMLGKSAKVMTFEELGESRAQLLGGTEVSRTLLYIVLALCLLETLLAQRFGHFRE
ncbi:MAG: hypothetical protein PHU85_12485, partial [Phycisphaerae bacterium]|nr:hypothetical protein [Phycisphaerae bacterium]